jgi:hypothetical protein
VSRTGRAISALRPATLVAGGAFAVHQLSYLAADGSHAGAPDHAYLGALLPVLAVLVALTVLATVEAGLGGGMAARRRSPVRRALTYAAAILAVFAVQEIAEGAIARDGLTVLVSPVGLVAVPLALGFGTLAWLAARGLDAVEGCIAARFGLAFGACARSGFRPRRPAVVLTPAVLPGDAAPRAPPST